MKKRIKTLVALGLVMAMVTGCGNSAQKETETSTAGKSSDSATENSASVNNDEEESSYPEYLNMEGAYPILKDEYAGEIKLKVAMLWGSGCGEWEDIWFSKYLKEKYNIELEVELIMDSAMGEKKSLMFNTGELPDIMINFGLTTAELMNYGVKEGLLLDCTDYINEELTPGLAYWFEDSTVRGACTTPDGAIYTLPGINRADSEGSVLPRASINVAWLESQGLKVPTTLDEFTEAMYALKEADPGNVGSENMYPLSGSANGRTNGTFLLNAFGYSCTDTVAAVFGLEPALRNGEAVLPIYDMDVFQEYLKLLKQYYEDGIISSDYFTMDFGEVDTQVMTNRTAVSFELPAVFGGMVDTDWDILSPLTSEWNEEPLVPQFDYVTVGNFVISADTEYPELCMKFADIYYNFITDDPYATWVGSGVGSEWDYGYCHAEFDPEKKTQVFDESKMEGLDLFSYLLGRLAGYPPLFGAVNSAESVLKHFPDYDFNNFDDTPLGRASKSLKENLVPYMKEKFPSVYYLDEESTLRISELKTIIDPYVKEQVALFVIGERPLSETEEFIDELEGMGIQELVGYYQQIYSSYK